MLLCISLLPPPPSSTLSPYTTLFRSVTSSVPLVVVDRLPSASFAVAAIPSVKFASFAGVMVRLDRFQLCTRTEEHTSELQSHFKRLCRRLLPTRNALPTSEDRLLL